MKKTIFTMLASAAAVAGAYAQGQVAWAPTAANGGLVEYSTDSATAVGFPTGNPSLVAAGNGQYTGEALHVDFYQAPLGTVLATSGGLPNFTTAWTFVGANLQQTKVSAGRMSATVQLVAGTAGADVQLEVVGWTGTATSWAAEVAAPGGTLLGYGGETFAGNTLGALGWDQPTGNPGGATPDRKSVV